MRETNVLNQSNPESETSSSPVERMYFAWNDVLSRNDATASCPLRSGRGV